MKKALALILVAVFGTAVMFAQEVKKETKTEPVKKEAKVTKATTKDAAKPVEKKEMKTTKMVKKESGTPTEKKEVKTTTTTTKTETAKPVEKKAEPIKK